MTIKMIWRIIWINGSRPSRTRWQQPSTTCKCRKMSIRNCLINSSKSGRGTRRQYCCWRSSLSTLLSKIQLFCRGKVTSTWTLIRLKRLRTCRTSTRSRLLLSGLCCSNNFNLTYRSCRMLHTLIALRISLRTCRRVRTMSSLRQD